MALLTQSGECLGAATGLLDRSRAVGAGRCFAREGTRWGDAGGAAAGSLRLGAGRLQTKSAAATFRCANLGRRLAQTEERVCDINGGLTAWKQTEMWVVGVA